MRETYVDVQGTERFKPNKIVQYLLEDASADLNQLWRLHQAGFFNRDEMREFYQLINYSVAGYEDVFWEDYE